MPEFPPVIKATWPLKSNALYPLICLESFLARQSWQKIQKVEPVTPIDMLKLAGLLVNLDYDRSASDEGQKGLQSACE
jgi:hypothetical protein